MNTKSLNKNINQLDISCDSDSFITPKIKPTIIKKDEIKPNNVKN